MADAPERTSWKAFFNAHAPAYMQNAFTRWTASEVSYIEELFELPAGARVLDIGCGTGRHAVEFAKRGYRVTGVDFSAGMLAEARAAANGAGVDVRWIEADATQLHLDEEPFDLVLCLCEGGLGLADWDVDPVTHDLDILRCAFAHTRPGGAYLSTAMNGYMTIRQMTDEHVANGVFDPATMVSQYVDTWKLPDGERTIHIRERLLIPPEMVAMLRHVGFEVLHVWGGTAGEWGRRPVKLDEIEAMYVCRRPA